MIQWKRVKSATEWGFFFGIVSWLIASGISNKIPALGVWGIILSRSLMGFIIGIVNWELLWWVRGLVLSTVINIPAGAVVLLLGVGWIQGFWPMLITGMIFGLMIELILRHKQSQEIVS